MKDKCHMPTYVISIISTLIATICGLVVWTYQKDMASAKDSIKEATVDIVDLKQKQAVTETNQINIEKRLNTIDGKLDRILNKV
jgi:lysophospholipid acyltransferase (LPLAT)-like uncharacterized protein